ncbi:MAG: YidC/Oxa1 family insertase periplasmic-domain containing protein [Candidatus Omnitrophota bacterium]
MEKRFLIACALSLMILMVSSTWLKKPQPTVNKDVKENLIGDVVEKGRENFQHFAKDEVSVEEPNLLLENNLHVIETDAKTLTFSKQGGFLLDVFDKKLSAKLPFTKIGYVPKWGTYTFSVAELPKGVVFECVTKNGTKIKKCFRIKGGNEVELSITIDNKVVSNSSIYDLYVAYFDASAVKDPLAKRYFESCVSLDERVVRKSVYKVNKTQDYAGNVEWVGLRDRYSCVVVLSQTIVKKAVVEPVENGACLALAIPERRVSKESVGIEDHFVIYVGPQDLTSLKEVGAGAEKIVNFGVFDSISRAILFLLNAFFRMTNNWGVAIILVTILIYVALSPLSIKSMMSMKKMQSLQPKIEQLKLKNKDNPQKLNIEIMELYRREKVNPLGGCLPMILQIPVFFALYQLLMRLINLKGAHFLWIKDLSEPDKLFVFKNSLPIIGNDFNLLPLMMAGGMFLQQKMSAVNSDAVATEQQKMLTFVMPVVFCFLFYKLPSGLVLYWFVNSMLMFIFQWKILRKNA